MMKPTMLYVSPFWPQRSGISEYSETLVWGLRKFFNITILTKKKTIDNQSIKKEFLVQAYKETEDYSGYDYIIYNFGNSPDNHDYMYDMIQQYPGYVILHDFTLYYLTLVHYRDKGQMFQKIYELEGIKGLITVKESIKESGIDDLIQHKHLPPSLPMNKEVLQAAKGIIVHSHYIKDKIHAISKDIPVHKIELVDCMPEVNFVESDYLRTKYHFKDDDFIIGAVGMIAPSKQNEIACKAVVEYNKNHKNKVKYVMIGEGNYVDSYICKDIIKTGFLQNKEFFSAIKSCDLIFNLRYPYNGESSATLMQCLLMGKNCIVTDIGWFGELPETCVKKVSVEVDINRLQAVIEEAISGERMNEEGMAFVKNKCNASAVSKSINKFLTSDKVR
ncbi:MAG: hypothetical protein IJZ42_04270 [Lachnospiraceae bacterium]|nr:hypothetical protein [Lachnospiraceae bacterium]